MGAVSHGATMDLDAVNADPLLRDTPAGDVVIRQLDRDTYALFALDQHEPDLRPERLFHVLDKRGVIDAFAGRHFWESKRIVRIYNETESQKKEREKREQEDTRAYFQAHMEKFIRRHGDEARAAVAALFGVRQ